MYLGIEIGALKLQLAVGQGDGSPFVDFRRATIRLDDGAGGIRRQIDAIGRELVGRHQPRAVGIGFGGPVDTKAGRTITSHQVEGWTDFALVYWCRATFGLPAALSNDSDAAGLAEALFGAGRGHQVVFYTNVGSGIGGALVTDGRVYPGGQGIAAEIGNCDQVWMPTIRMPRSSRAPAVSVLPRPAGRGWPGRIPATLPRPTS